MSVHVAETYCVHERLGGCVDCDLEKAVERVARLEATLAEVRALLHIALEDEAEHE